MGIQEVKKNKKKLRQRRHDGVRAGDHPVDGENVVWVLAPGLTLSPPPQQLKPVKTGRRRRRGPEPERGEEEEEEVGEAVTTPKGEECRIPAAEAGTCPPAPKKPRTAVVLRDSRRCNCDGEAVEFFRVPVDLDAVFASLAAKAN